MVASSRRATICFQSGRDFLIHSLQLLIRTGPSPDTSFVGPTTSHSANLSRCTVERFRLHTDKTPHASRNIQSLPMQKPWKVGKEQPEYPSIQTLWTMDERNRVMVTPVELMLCRLWQISYDELLPTSDLLPALNKSVFFSNWIEWHTHEAAHG